MASRPIRIAVEGCGHGTLHAIYASVQQSCEFRGWDGVDLLIIGGDFQAVRNASDLQAMAVPAKYHEMGDFHEYYSGQRHAPCLTIFVGGNHEASNHLWELYYGGWVAPNIYYMGAANVLRLGPLRIAGLSGIWKGYDYQKPHHERLPYSQDDVRSIYHVREIDTRKLCQLRTQVDIGISHDWPCGVEWMGDHQGLFRYKSFLRSDAESGQLGSVAAMNVLKWLKPYHWFSAHLHARYAAVVRHAAAIAPAAKAAAVRNDAEIALDLDDDDDDIDSEAVGDKNLAGAEKVASNPAEIDLALDLSDAEDEKSQAQTTSVINETLRAQLPAAFARPIPAEEPPKDIPNQTTQFLALSKCLAGQHFLQLLEVGAADAVRVSDDPLRLQYDPEWLAITRVFAEHIKVGDREAAVERDRGRASYYPLIRDAQAWVEERLVKADRLTVPENFEATAPAYDATAGLHHAPPPREYTNPQTSAFCELLAIPNPFAASEQERDARLAHGPPPAAARFHRGGSSGFHRGRGRGRGGRGGGSGPSRGRGSRR